MNYINEIADFYLAMNPDKKILDGTDYTIIAEWEKEEIPIFLVRSSIQKICGTISDNETEMHSLEYMRPALKESFRNWLQEAGRG